MNKNLKYNLLVGLLTVVVVISVLTVMNTQKVSNPEGVTKTPTLIEYQTTDPSIKCFYVETRASDFTYLSCVKQ